MLSIQLEPEDGCKSPVTSHFLSIPSLKAASTPCLETSVPMRGDTVLGSVKGDFQTSVQLPVLKFCSGDKVLMNGANMNRASIQNKNVSIYMS